MRLLELELKNIKAYQEATIAFGPGVNGLLGQNGAGKTTILQAIGYALFNCLSPAIKDFTREGHSRGSIRVRMRSAKDHLTYDIHRTVGGGSRNYVYNCDDGFKVQEGTDNVLAFVQDHLGVPGAPDMKTLFRDAVGIEQGTFQAPFLMGPAPRKDHFGPLLGIEKYRRIDAELNATRAYAQQRVADCRATLGRLEGQLEPLDRLRARQLELQTALQALEAETQTIQEARDAGQAQLQQLDALEHRVQEVKTRHSAASLEHARLLERANSLDRELAKAREAAQQAAQHAKAHWRYREAERQLEPVEANLQSLQGLQRKLSQLQGEMGLLQDQVQDKQTQIARLHRLQSRLDELQPAKNEAEEVRRKLDQCPSQTSHIDALTKELDSLRSQLVHNETDRDAIRREVAERDSAEMRMAEIQSLQADHVHDQQALELQRNSVHIQRDTLDRQLKSLQQAQHDHSRQVRCPVCEQGLSRDLIAALTARLETEIGDGSQALDELCQRRMAIVQAQDPLQAESNALHAAMAVCRDQRDLEICLANLARLREEISERTRERERLEAIQATRQQWQERRETLRPAVEEWEQADRALTAKSRGDEDLAELRRALRHKEADAAQIAEVTDHVEDLADQVRQLRLQRDENRSGYHSYVAHEAAAQGLTDLEKESSRLALQMEQAEQELSDLERRQTDLEAQYEPQAHGILQESVARWNTELAGKEATLQVQRQNLEEVKRDVAALHVLARKQEQESKRLALLQHREDRVIWVKDLMRRALPKITAALIQSISELANVFFCALMGDHTRSLQWDAEFGIVLNVKGKERSFRQLSGGEQMAASLSVIMALLRRLSNVQFVFLDEPTGNLDVERRSQLASSLRTLGGLEQIFVISHDDTFEEHLDHVVRLESGPEGSRVVAEI